MSHKYVWVDKRIVGEVVGVEFQKDRWHSQALMLRKPKLAIAFDHSTLIDAQMLGANRAKITDLDSKLIFRATFAEILGGGFPVQRNCGNQIALQLGAWEIRDVYEDAVSFEDVQKRIAKVLNIPAPKTMHVSKQLVLL